MKKSFKMGFVGILAVGILFSGSCLKPVSFAGEYDVPRIFAEPGGAETEGEKDVPRLLGEKDVPRLLGEYDVPRIFGGSGMVTPDGEYDVPRIF